MDLSMPLHDYALSPLSAKLMVYRLQALIRKKPARSRSKKSFDRGTYDRVGTFMHEHAINPSPENYDLVFRFVIKKDVQVAAFVKELIETGYALDNQRQPEITDQFEKDLANLANITQEQLGSIEQIISRSRGDASEYSTALQDASGHLDFQRHVDNEALMSLCELTRAMIVKTRSVESELRNRGKAIEGLIGSLDEAKSRADIDALTGLSNRRAFERLLGASVERAKQSSETCALAICDIDRFKTINDSHGHQTGDRVIRAVADNLVEYCYGKGHVFRFGGEEYVILFENVAREEALQCLEAARETLAGKQFKNLDTKRPMGTITFSAGLSILGMGDDPGTLLGNADRALYQAKSAGRNCIKIHEPAAHN
jgi:diguanylate cyclase